jgi:hypothetical protein
VAAAKGKVTGFPKGQPTTLAQVLLDLAQNPAVVSKAPRDNPNLFLKFLQRRYPKVPAQQLRLLAGGKLETIQVQLEAEFELSSPKARVYITYSITF